MNKTLWEQCKDWKQKYEFIDLTHELSPETPHWSGFPALEYTTPFSYPDGFLVQKYTLVSQYGTHVDAPSHFVEGKRHLHEIQPEEMILPLCVVDISGKVAECVDTSVSVEDILAWEAEYGEIPPKAFVALRTDWSLREDLDNVGADGNKHYPGWSFAVLQFLVEQREVSAIGHETSDTDASMDIVKNGVYQCEYYILEQQRYQIELMKDLYKVPPVGSVIFCGFPKAKDSAGFTARCIAMCPKD